MESSLGCRLEAKAAIQGDFPPDTYRVAWKQRLEDFCAVLKGSHPALVLKASQDEEIKKSIDPILVESDDEESTTAPNSNGRKRPAATGSAPVTPSKRPRAAQSATPQRRNGFVRFSLDDIHNTLQQVSASNIPNSADPRVVEMLIKESTERWEVLLSELLHTTAQDLQVHIMSLVDQHFSKWNNTEPAVLTRKIIGEYVDAITTSHGKLALRSLEAERLKPFTLNEEWIEYQERKEHDFLREKRIDHRARILIEAEEAHSRGATEGRACANKTRLYIPRKTVRADTYLQESKL